MTEVNFQNTGIQDKDRSNRFWLKTQLLGHSKNGRYVPNPDDLVVDWDQGFYRVMEVDYSTGKSVIAEWKPLSSTTSQSEADLLLGAGPGVASEACRAFLDTSVTPHVITPDQRLLDWGDEAQYYKLFLGTDVTDTGRVIAFIRDTNGNPLGENIPLKEPANWSKQTRGRYATSAYTTESLADGTKVTAVGYTNEGRRCTMITLIVKNSGATRYLEASRRYVRGISIESPFITAGDNDTIEFPLNVPVKQLPLVGVVYYSDGSKEKMAIDGNRMTLHGVENYTATVQGQTFGLVLTYTLADDEVAYEQLPTTNRRITRTYRAKTIEADGAYTVKLFVYPVWEPSAGKYHLEYWLYNLDRRTFYNVTPMVELGANSLGFDPTGYGTLQTITVAVDLSRVDTQFKNVRHVQTFQVTLSTRGSETTDNWMVKFRPGQKGGFGQGVAAKVTQGGTNAWRLNITQDAVSKETWLTKLFYGVEPLFNESFETQAPEPTHFRIVTLNNKYERSVDQWDQTFEIVNDLKQGELIYIEWIKRTDSTDLQLGITGLPVHVQS